MGNRVLLNITFGVVSLHLLAMAWSVYSPSSPSIQPTKKLLVKTLQLSPKPEMAVAAPRPIDKPRPVDKPRPKDKPKPQEKPKPKEKPRPKDKVKDKLPDPKPEEKIEENPAPEKPEPKINPALLAIAQESFAKIHQSRDKRSASGNIPGKIEALAIESETDDSMYESELAVKLRMMLRLPEFGSVDIKLTLDRSGKVLGVETVRSENETNKKYVEKNVPGLRFPSFGKYFGKSKQVTFAITLTNE